MPNTRRQPALVILHGGETPDDDPVTASPDTIAYKAPAEDALDVKDIQARLERLLPFADTHVNALSRSARSDLVSLRSAANLTHHIPDEYARFYAIVTSVFNRPESYHPSTVGAFFAGCRNVETDAGACMIPCAGSLPRPGRAPCGVFVFWGIPDPTKPGGFKIERSHQPDEPTANRAILYIPKGSKFLGLSDQIVDHMLRMNVLSIVVVPWDPETTSDPNEITSAGYVPVESLRVKFTEKALPPTSEEKKTEAPAKKSDSNEEAETSKTNWWLIILVILVAILLVVVIVFFVRYMTRRNAY